jgi:hypothetical protein
VNGFEETENLKRGKVGGVKPIDRTERQENPRGAAGNGKRRTGKGRTHEGPIDSPLNL